MTFWSGDTFFKQLFLQSENQLTIFGMHSGYGSELQRPCETVNEYFVACHDGAFVRHEMLKAVNAVIADQRFHIVVYAIVPPGYGDMKRVIGNGLLCPFAPLLVGFQDILLWCRNHEIDNHRGTAGEASRGSGLKIFARNGSHKRQLHVRVRINAARHDELATGINDSGAARRINIHANLGNQAVSTKYVRPNRKLGVNNCTAFDENVHFVLPISPRAMRK